MTVQRLSLLPAIGCIAMLLAACDSTASHENVDVPALPETLLPADISAGELLLRKRVYVPVYSSIYWRSQHTTDLVATMSVRNVDPDHPIYLISVTYYDSAGEVIRTYQDEIGKLGPVATADFVIPYSDKAGGAGANFIVEWGATQAVSDPIIETVMFGQAGSAGISFTSRGQVIDEIADEISAPSTE